MWKNRSIFPITMTERESTGFSPENNIWLHYYELKVRVKPVKRFRFYHHGNVLNSSNIFLQERSFQTIVENAL